jgi:ergothioneine biosynthesis protein EgtB
VTAVVDDYPDTETLKQRFVETRQFTQRIVASLSPEDCMVQSMDDVSPTRWHLAHTTWFFETFALRNEADYQPFDDRYNYLFNSYYNTIGEQYPRSRRGMISRPDLNEIKQYRANVDEQVLQRLESPDYAARMRPILEVGFQHEQQHQELILTDIKHVLSCNPTYPAYQQTAFDETTSTTDSDIEVSEGVVEIGHDGDGFAFDNESPRHKAYVPACTLSSRLVTCGEYLEFIEDGGYQCPDHWLSLGWNTVEQESWTAPLYWTRKDGQWMHFTLAGLEPIHLDWPVCHVSLFEADAFARWSGKRLPTEFEWEVAATQHSLSDLDAEPFADFLFDRQLAVHPTRSPTSLMGGVWQWTSSSYAPYPGYRVPSGAIGEYNAKFMCNQYVLRGGSVATHSTHIRPTYRNFFPASARWQFTGIRLAEDA